MLKKTYLIAVALGLVLVVADVRAADEPTKVGIVEHLGDRLALEDLSFFDEDGRPITLKDLFDRPIVLTLVYYKCPGICTPLLQELAAAVDKCDLVPGEDYRIVTISFDPTETAELARPKKANMIAEVKTKVVPPDGWRFLTGDAENVRAITEAVGFRYIPDRNKTDFIHAATVMFLSTDGMIARYLNGTVINPAELELAVIDASEGRARSFMQKIQKLCYSYDPAGRAYVLKVNRIILGVTLLFALAFGGFLLFKKTAHRPANVPTTGSVS
jgi:protein SCO1/2